MFNEAERFKKMVEDSQDWFWEFDENANFTYASPRIRDLLGYEPEELIGANAFDLMEADEAARVRQHFDPICQKYLPFKNLVNINIHKEGRKVVIESSGTPIFDNDGRFCGYRGIDRDITGQKSVEGAFHKSQAMLDATEHLAHVGSWKLDLTTNNLSWSDEVYRIFGLAPQEFAATYEAFLAFVHPDDRAAVDAAYSGSLHEGSGGYEIEHRIIRKNSGEIGHVLERCIHERDETGTIVNSLGMVQDITERRCAEELLRESAAKLNDILETSTEWIWGIDLSGNHTYSNGALRVLLGYSLSEFVGRNYAEFIHADDLAEVDRVLPLYIKEKRGWQGWLLRWRHKDGSYRWMESNAKPVVDASGEVIGFRGADRDVTERKRIEEELRQSEVTFKKLFSDSSDAILLIDSAGVFVECNQAALDLLKMTRKQFLLSPPAKISPEFQPDGRRSAESAPEMIALAHSKGLHRFDWTCVNAEGSEFVVEVSLMPIVIKGQTMLHTTWRDITERKRLENELLLSRERLHNILTLLPQTIYEADFEGRLTFANQTAFDLFGYSQEDFSTGVSVLDMVIPEDVGRARENIGKLYMGGEEGGYEYNARKKDGTTFPVLIYSSVIRKDGSPCGLRGTIVDISKRKKYEQELEKARDMAESMSRAKDEFLANMSHELRTPITAVLGFAELLEETQLTEQQQKYLGTIASSTEILLALVDDLLDLARIEAGKVYLTREEFSLRKLIGDVANSQNPAAKAKGLTFNVQVSAEVPDRLMGDSLRLKQILLNLAVNAIKFSERGGVCLTVAVEKFHPTTPMLRFDVVDTGIGIRTEDIAEIFNPFSQVDPSSTRKFGGAGLGLAICTKLMAIMGGEISVDSCEGVGSTFHVRLPFEVVDSETEGGGAHTRCQAAVTEGPPLRVLLVEDHEISQYFFSEVLKRCGHHVDLAANGAEALGKLQCRTYDLVLMDVQMPVMDGLEAIGKIREMEQVGGGHLPVIALTAHAMEKDRVEVLSKGFDGYVSKPMKVDALLDEIKRCLSLFQ